MGLAANLLDWQAAHPEEARAAQDRGRAEAHRRKQRRFHKQYPEHGTYDERMAWYEAEFLDRAEYTPAKSDDLLTKAFMCLVRLGPTRGGQPDDPMEQYKEHLAKQVREREARNGKE